VTPEIEVCWPKDADERLRSEFHHVMYAVVERGGAVGYLTPPTRAETDGWLEETLAAARAGDGAVALATVDGRVSGCGAWRRGPAPIFGHYAEVQKVMAHPAARGLGLGRLVTGALVENARAAGVETLALGVRGNNHGAIDLYEQLGFREWGRLPNVIAVGEERYDDVRMFLDLGHGPEVIRRGSQPGGPGSSPGRR
jgi:ribosomal protein S18 acetylase RimI-like enzyme